VWSLDNPRPLIRSVRFDAFELDLRAAELRSEARKIRLQNKPFQILVLLLENHGEVVTRDEIRKKLWTADTIVAFDHGIDTALKKLRQALGDDAAKPRYIETLARRGYRWIAAVDWAQPKFPSGSSSEENLRETIDSIAVLPFSNLSGDIANEYFSDGLSEEIIYALTHIPGLKVIARTSAFVFKGRDQDIREIAAALGVANILQGAVRRAGTRVRITVQLITAANGSHLWSERFDREATDVFAIQDEIAQEIAAALRLKLLSVPAAFRRHTPNFPAYEAFLKARHHLEKFTPDSLARARLCYEQAIALDPEFALAHAELGRYYARLSIFGLTPPHETAPLMRAAALKALGIDPSLPEAHFILGGVASAYDYDWKGAERQFRLAMARDPVPPIVRTTYGLNYLMAIGRTREAIEEHQRALNEDPLNLITHFQLALCLQAAGRDPEAYAELHQLRELDENFHCTFWALGVYNVTRGLFAEALALAEKAHSLAPWASQNTGLLAGVLSRTGLTSRAESLLEKLALAEAYGTPLGLMFFHLVCAEIDKAAHWAEKAIEQRDTRMIMFLSLPLMKTLRSSLRWPVLARQMNLPTTAC
jgi:TolB-like protein/Tfp pilus assembly protein PilF